MSDSEKPAPTSASDVRFTDKEERVLRVVWGCMRTVPEVDMNKLTAAAGFQTLKTCTNTWGQIKKKLMAQAAANGVEVDLMSKTAKSPKKRRNAPDDDSNDALAAVAPKAESKSEPESEGKPEPKPKKARKTTVKKEKPVKEEIDDEDAAIVGAD